MKRILIAGVLAAMLGLTACSGTAQQSSGAEIEETSSKESRSEGLTIHADEDVDSAYVETLKTYFTAIEKKDFAAFQSVMYPPYLESYNKYLNDNGTTPEENFEKLCTRFDEDGYESWTLTDLHISYYPEEKVDLDDFFSAFKDAGILDDKLIEQCKKESEEIRDVQFSLYALYAGDEDAVPVVNGNEIMMVKTKDGTYLFG